MTTCRDAPAVRRRRAEGDGNGHEERDRAQQPGDSCVHAQLLPGDLPWHLKSINRVSRTEHDADSRSSISPRSSRAALPPRRSGTRSTSRSTPSGGAITATGSRSITTCPRSRARQRRSSSPMSPEAPRPSASAPAASCCRTIRRSSSRSSSARSSRSSPAASISALAARLDADQVTALAPAATHQHRHVPAGRDGTDGALPRAARPDRGARVPGAGLNVPDLDPRLEPVRRAARRRSWACRSRSRHTSRRRS